MKKPISLDDAIGKKLTGHSFGDDENVLLVFEDSYVVIDVEHGYGEDFSLSDSQTAPENLYGFNLVQLGILTQAEHDAIEADKQARQEAAFIQRERQQYEWLKLKFGTPIPTELPEPPAAKPLGGATLVFPVFPTTNQ